MIAIGYNQVQEKHVTNGSGAASEAKKVYVGNKLAHVHVNDNTEFALRQTLNGYIHEDNDLYAKISKIKGNTKVWNQLYDNAVPTATSGHKYYISEDNSGTTTKSIATTIAYTADSTDRMCIDLTLIYGAGNEPTTVAEFEADFQKWFGRPIGAEPYDAGSLIPFLSTGIKSTWTKDGVQKESTIPIPVITLTGKQSGSSTSEVIFPDGMKSAGSVKDEVYVEDGKTYAVKRVGSRAYVSGDESDTTVVTDGHSTTYYELATPIVYEVDNYTLPLYYPANGTGTEEIVNTATSAPADMDIEYRLLEEEWYGIRWRMTDDAWVSPVRIGNPRLHQELPIQSMMKRCALVNGVPKFISEFNVDEYEDGTAVDYANTDIYVQIPEYYFEATKDDDGWCELRIHTKVKIGTKSRLYYEGAWLATLDNNVLGSKSYIDFNAIGSPTDGTYNAALFKNATNFVANTPRGGNGSTAYDDTEGCIIGRPKTSIPIADFRTYAHNNSNRHGIVNYDCWCSIMRLFMVEFCSFYSQNDIDDTLTVHKFRKGGLSAGVTSGLTSWSNFNGYNPLIPCGFTKSLGNRTGVIKMHYAAEGAQTSAVNISVPSYRGIEEPFGDIYNIVDGIAIYGDGADTQKASIYIATATTIDNNAYVTPSGANAAPIGYELLTDDAPYKGASDSETSGWIKVWHWDEHGMFAPLKTGGDSTTIGLTDYMYMYNNTGWRLLMAGGYANYSGAAGLGCFAGNSGFGRSYAAFGSRLLYTPAS